MSLIRCYYLVSSNRLYIASKYFFTMWNFFRWPQSGLFYLLVSFYRTYKYPSTQINSHPPLVCETRSLGTVSRWLFRYATTDTPLKLWNYCILQFFFQEFQKRFEIFRENMKKVQFLRETEWGTGKYGASPFADMVNKCVTSYLGDL